MLTSQKGNMKLIKSVKYFAIHYKENIFCDAKTIILTAGKLVWEKSW